MKENIKFLSHPGEPKILVKCDFGTVIKLHLINRYHLKKQVLHKHI